MTFGPFSARGQRLLQRVLHLRHAVGARDGLDPLHAHAAHGALDRMLRRADRVLGPRGQDVLPAGGRGVAVVHDQQHVVGAVEHRVAHAAGEPVVPEAAVAHDADGALAGLGGVERRGTGPAQAVAHGRGADVEGRQDREQVTADVAADVMRSELAFHQLHRGEYRALGAAGAEGGRAPVDLLLRLPAPPQAWAAPSGPPAGGCDPAAARRLAR